MADPAAAIELLFRKESIMSMSKKRRALPLAQRAGITDSGYSIGVTASIRVQWWLAHAH